MNEILMSKHLLVKHRTLKKQPDKKLKRCNASIFWNRTIQKCANVEVRTWVLEQGDPLVQTLQNIKRKTWRSEQLPYACHLGSPRPPCEVAEAHTPTKAASIYTLDLYKLPSAIERPRWGLVCSHNIYHSLSKYIGWFHNRRFALYEVR